MIESTLDKWAAARLSGRGAIWGVLDGGDLRKQITPTSTEVRGQAEPHPEWKDFYRCYEQVSWVRSCVDVIGKAASSRGWYLSPLVQDPDPAQKEILEEFFARPNPEDTMSDIVFQIATDFGIFANSFLEIVRDAEGKPTELWPMDPIVTEVVVDKGSVSGYKSYEDLSRPTDYAIEEVLHLKFGTRQIVTTGTQGRSMYAVSPLTSLSLSAEIYLWAQIYNRAFFCNGAKTRGLWVMPEATPEQVKRNRTELKEMSKPEHSHQDLILEGKGVDYRPVGTAMKDMEFRELCRFLRDEILAVYGVPPSLVSIIETGNIGSGSGETQQENFLEETVIPQQTRIEGAVTRRVILEGFGFSDYAFKLKTPEILSEKTQAEVDVSYVQVGVLSPEEVKILRFPTLAFRKSLSPRDLAVPKGRTKKTVEVASALLAELKAELKRQAVAVGDRFGQATRDAIARSLEQNLKGRPMEMRYTPARSGILVFRKHTWPTFLKQVGELEEALSVLSSDPIREILERNYREIAASAARAAGLALGATLPASSFDAYISARAAELADYLVGQLADSSRETILEGVRDGLSPGAIQDNLRGLDSYRIEVSRPGAASFSRDKTFQSVAEAVARTDTQAVFNTVEMKYFQEAGVERVRWIAASNPDPVCAEYAGKIYRIDELPAIPPVHHNCRCALEPIRS